jgi:hypothetical protein
MLGGDPEAVRLPETASTENALPSDDGWVALVPFTLAELDAAGDRRLGDRDGQEQPGQLQTVVIERPAPLGLLVAGGPVGGRCDGRCDALEASLSVGLILVAPVDGEGEKGGQDGS